MRTITHTNVTKYSRMEKVKFVKGSLKILKGYGLLKLLVSGTCFCCAISLSSAQQIHGFQSRESSQLVINFNLNCCETLHLFSYVICETMEG